MMHGQKNIKLYNGDDLKLNEIVVSVNADSYNMLVGNLMSAAQMTLEVVFMFRFVFAVDAMELCLFATLDTNVT